MKRLVIVAAVFLAFGIGLAVTAQSQLNEMGTSFRVIVEDQATGGVFPFLMTFTGAGGLMGTVAQLPCLGNSPQPGAVFIGSWRIGRHGMIDAYMLADLYDGTGRYLGVMQMDFTAPIPIHRQVNGRATLTFPTADCRSGEVDYVATRIPARPPKAADAQR